MYLSSLEKATSTDTCPSSLPIEFDNLSNISSSLSFFTLTPSCPINTVFMNVDLFILKKYFPGSSLLIYCTSSPVIESIIIEVSSFFVLPNVLLIIYSLSSCITFNSPLILSPSFGVYLIL